MNKNDWTIIYHTADSSLCPHIHSSFYEKSNPSANILHADGREYFLPTPYSSYKVKDVNYNIEVDFSKMALHDSNGDELRSMLVRNHDKFLRNWLKDNFHMITTNNVAFFEWDVLLNKELPHIKIEGFNCWSQAKIRDVSSKNYANKKTKFLGYCKEALKYEKNIERFVAPFAGFYTTKDFIEQIISSKYDYLYELDIFCEVRMSILTYLTNVKLETNRTIFNGDAILTIAKRALELDQKYKNENEVPIGCFHPIKQKII